MEIKVMGIMSPMTTSEHNGPGFLITSGRNKVMLDCGSGSTRFLEGKVTSLENFSAILTHLHGDHYSDIIGIQYGSFSYHNQKRLEYPVSIYLPATPKEKCKVVMEEEDAFAKYKIIDEKSEITIGDMQISFCKTDHPIETYAVKVQEGDKNIVYTSDTSFSAAERLAEFAKDTDLLICESSLLKEHGFPEINSHLTAQQAGIIARKANARRLMLTHFWQEESIEKYVNEAKQEFFNVIAAREGQVIDMPVLQKER